MVAMYVPCILPVSRIGWRKIPWERSLADDDRGSVELSAAKLLIVFTRASQSASAYITSWITARELGKGIIVSRIVF
jgi:hypothetical protein